MMRSIRPRDARFLLRQRIGLIAGGLCLVFFYAAKSFAGTNYVDAANPTPVSPYTSWQTAATNIQDAVDVAMDGDTVLVTDGVYNAGWMVVHGSMTNRIAITNAVIVCSVNGTDSTFVVGSGPLGDTAVRCAYVGDGARLEGFTLTNGHTRTSGDYSTEQRGGGAWCESTAVVSNCTITGNSAYSSGGLYSGEIQYCTISGNSADWDGGGVYGGTVRNCTIAENTAGSYGGGAYNSTVENCAITGNSAESRGGGAYGGTLQNCVLTGNSANYYGGGTYNSTVENCTITGNSAESRGGGTYNSTVQNCIVYYNSATLGDANYRSGTIAYSCTTPEPLGVGNIDTTPGLSGLANPHLLPDSPCIDAGTNQDWMVTVEDIDGEPRLGNGTVDMGCDEVYEGGLTGTLSAAAVADYTNVTAGFTIGFEADIQGRPEGYRWLWGDGGIVSNAVRATHAYDSPGDYDVALHAWNLDSEASATVTVHVAAAYTNYVSLSGSHTAPYETWSTAATNIQTAISASTLPGGLILVTNGVYDTGGVVVHGGMTNRIAITNAVMVRSVNGPDNTFIMGSGPLGDTAVRCAYVGDGARLEGFTLTNGHTRTNGDIYKELSGGGAWCEPTAVVFNCIISGNSVDKNGGGTYHGTIENCTITGNAADYGGGTYEGTVRSSVATANSARFNGGGTSGGTVENCTITGNSANIGGGTSGGAVRNCIVYYNLAIETNANCNGGAVTFTCTVPDLGGEGNITNAPGLAALSNPHIVSDSFCIDAGTNQDGMVTAVDIDGEPRIGNSVVDMGCDEVYAGGLTNTLAVGISSDYTSALIVDYPIRCEAVIQGRPEGYRWLWGDGESASNTMAVSHVYTNIGDYNLVLEAWNVAGAVSATLTVHVVEDYTNFVSMTGSHVAPFDTWATAATNIQDAIALVAEGGTVLVTDGVYEYGGTLVHGDLTNRIAITKVATVRSANGPESTFIVGSGPLGDAAVRCAYVGNGARLEGFTLTNGHTRVTGAVSTERSGGGAWCEATGVVSNCIVVGNTSETHGGGIYGGMVQDSVLAGNSAGHSGGGANESTVDFCDVTGNTAHFSGGGTYGGTVRDCNITGNTAGYGGGTCLGDVERCAISGNSARFGGGGTSLGTIRNCAISANTATIDGGGASYGDLQNTTISGNTADRNGGGTFDSVVRNGIVYYNEAAESDPNCSLGGETVGFTCTVPDPGGIGNITNEPGVVGANISHIVWSSPCIDAGTNQDWMVEAVDIDGDPRIGNGIVDMGCDELHVGGLTGALAVAVLADYTNVVAGYPVRFEADIQGRPAGFEWLWENGESSANTPPWASRTYNTPGDYEVVLWAWNLDGIASASVTVHVLAGYTNYVSLAGSHTAPYETWATAATNIQAAIEAQSIPRGVTLVTNGVYDIGAVVLHDDLTNRVAVTKPITVQSVNGPEATFIVGSGPLGDAAVRCAYVGDGARLEGFTLTNGHTRLSGIYDEERSGGGVRNAPGGVVSSCIVVSNAAVRGGGISGGTARNCLVVGNAAKDGGGGTYKGTILSCTVAGNTSTNLSGGGALWSTIRNSIVYYNKNRYSSPDDVEGGSVDHTCTIDIWELDGPGNISALPRFVNAGIGDYHLLPTSPCINMGTNEAWMAGAGDFDGSPRIIAGTVDMGAYEVLQANLAVTKSGPVYALPGTDIEYVIAVTNLNSLTATNVWLTDDLPVGVTPTNMAPTDLGNLVPGASTSITVTVNVDSNTLGLITNTASVDSDLPEGDTADNTSASVTFVGAPDDDPDSDGLTNAEEIGYGTDLLDPDTDGDGMRDGEEMAAGTDPLDADSYLSMTDVVSLSVPDRFVVNWASVTGASYAVYGGSNLVSGFDLLLRDEVAATPPVNVFTDTVNGIDFRCYRVQELTTGADPLGDGSYLELVDAASLPGLEGVIVTWSSESNKYYALYSATNLVEGFDIPVAGHIAATPPLNVYTDTLSGVTFRWYRVEVEP